MLPIANSFAQRFGMQPQQPIANPLSPVGMPPANHFGPGDFPNGIPQSGPQLGPNGQPINVPGGIQVGPMQSIKPGPTGIPAAPGMPQALGFATPQPNAMAQRLMMQRPMSPQY